jgi:transposase
VTTFGEIVFSPSNDRRAGLGRRPCHVRAVTSGVVLQGEMVCYEIAHPAAVGGCAPCRSSRQREDGHRAETVSCRVRRDVVAVARKGEAPLNQIAKDFGICEATLHHWLKKDDVDDGVRPGRTAADAAEVRELKRRNRLLEQENEVLRRAAAYLSQGNLPGGVGK